MIYANVFFPSSPLFAYVQSDLWQQRHSTFSLLSLKIIWNINLKDFSYVIPKNLPKNYKIISAKILACRDRFKILDLWSRYTSIDFSEEAEAH